MNISIDQYMAGLERSTKNLPRVLADWNDICDDLQDQYKDQLEWMLVNRRKVGTMFELANRGEEFDSRIKVVYDSLKTMESLILQKMDIDIYELIDD